MQTIVAPSSCFKQLLHLSRNETEVSSVENRVSLGPTPRRKYYDNCWIVTVSRHVNAEWIRNIWMPVDIEIWKILKELKLKAVKYST